MGKGGALKTREVVNLVHTVAEIAKSETGDFTPEYQEYGTLGPFVSTVFILALLNYKLIFSAVTCRPYDMTGFQFAVFPNENVPGMHYINTVCATDMLREELTSICAYTIPYVGFAAGFLVFCTIAIQKVNRFHALARGDRQSKLVGGAPIDLTADYSALLTKTLKILIVSKLSFFALTVVYVFFVANEFFWSSDTKNVDQKTIMAQLQADYNISYASSEQCEELTNGWCLGGTDLTEKEYKFEGDIMSSYGALCDGNKLHYERQFNGAFWCHIHDELGYVVLEVLVLISVTITALVQGYYCFEMYNFQQNWKKTKAELQMEKQGSMVVGAKEPQDPNTAVPSVRKGIKLAMAAFRATPPDGMPEMIASIICGKSPSQDELANVISRACNTEPPEELAAVLAKVITSCVKGPPPPDEEVEVEEGVKQIIQMAALAAVDEGARVRLHRALEGFSDGQGGEGLPAHQVSVEFHE